MVVQKAWAIYGSKIWEWKQNQWGTHFIRTEYIQRNEDMKHYGMSLGRIFKHEYGTYNWNDVQSINLEKEKFEVSIWNQFWRVLSQEVKVCLECKKINFFKQSALEYLHVLSNPVLALALSTAQFIPYMSFTQLCEPSER